jgi:hypothetical protein
MAELTWRVVLRDRVLLRAWVVAFLVSARAGGLLRHGEQRLALRDACP